VPGEAIVTTGNFDDDQKVKTAASKYASMTEAERLHRLEEYVANIEAHSDLVEFASLLCGEDVHFKS